MFLEKDKKFRIKSIYSIYTICFSVIAFFSFFWFVFFGKTFIHYGDGYWQHYSILVFFKKTIAAFFNGEGFSFWSWSLGLGADVLGNLANVFCDPFNYVVLLFPEKYVDVGYTIAVILRLFVAGITMMKFLQYMSKTKLQCLLGALGYAFSSWAIGSIRHSFFLTALVLFPLIILGIERIDREKKSFVFVFAVAASLITSLYFSYMSAIMAIIYVIVKYFYDFEKKSFVSFLKRFFAYVGYVLVAVMVAAPILIPVLYSLLNACKESGAEMKIFHTLSNFLRYIPSFVSNCEINGHFTYMTLPMIFLALLPMAIINYKQKRYRLQTVFAFLCVVMVAFPIFGSILNGFSYSAGRWCYILTFFFVYCLVSFFDLQEIRKYRSKYIKILFFEIVIIAISLLFAKVVFSVLGTGSTIVGFSNLLFIMIFAFLFLFSTTESENVKQYCVVIICMFVVNTSLNFFIDFSPNISNKLDEYMDAGISYERYISSAQRVGKYIHDDSFYRLDQMEGATYDGSSIVTRIPANENLFFGNRSIYSYVSTIDSKHYEFNKALNNNAGYFRRICVFSNDNRSRIDFLQGVKYFIGDNTNKKLNTSMYAGYGFNSYQVEDGIEILKSNYEPSLGYIYDQAISSDTFKQYSPVDKEQLLMQAAVIDDVGEHDVHELSITEASVKTIELGYHFNDSKNLINQRKKRIQIQGNQKTIEMQLDQVANNCELYVEFKNLERIPVSYDEQLELLKNNNLEYDNTEKLKKARFSSSNISYNPTHEFSVYVKKDIRTKRLINSEGVANGFNDLNDYLVNLGFYEIADGTLQITFSDAGTYTYDEINVYAVSQEDFDSQARKLSDNRYKVTTLHDNYVSGTVDSENGGILYLSILYAPGWKVYIDGERTETFVTNVGFTGVDISAGEHTVELRYRPFLFDECIVLMLIGCVCICVLVYKQKRRNVQ